MPLEREIKLRFEHPARAREAILAAGAVPYRPRRLQQDSLLDTADGRLRDARSALRVRLEPGAVLLTYKGPVQASAMKLREEIETTAADAEALTAILSRLGFQVWFRYEKYREEFAKGNVILAIDETPLGTFVEIEGSEEGVHACAAAVGRAPSDYLLDSYRSLFVAECRRRGVPAGDMLFERV